MAFFRGLFQGLPVRMKIVFGTELEGCPVPGERRGLGVAVVGSEGFANVLETALGLAPTTATGLDRLLAFRDALKDRVSANPKAFFATSFERDPLATASALLAWRDELALAGWDFSPVDDLPPRLRELAGMPGDGLAERLARIESALAGGAATGIEEVELAGAMEALPWQWRQVLKHLPVRPADSEPSASAPEGTALHALQRRLAGEVVEMPGDDSVRIFRAAEGSGLAACAASWLADESQRRTSLLIAARGRVSEINLALGQRDLPLVPEAGASEFASLPQLALLALRRHWKPFDPQAWLEFLLQPVSPVPGRLASRLAKAINEIPGRDHAAWQQAVAEARANADAEQTARIDQALKEWIDAKSFPESAADGAVLAETMASLSEWCGGIGAQREDDQAMNWLAASAAMFRLSQMIGRFPKISRLELERLGAAWLRTVSLSGSSGDLGQVETVRSPAQVLQPRDHVIWWQPESSRLPLVPWSAAERSYLAGRGVQLVDPDVARAERKRRELTPILRAKQSLTLFVVTQEQGRLIPPAAIVTRIIAEGGASVLRDHEAVTDRTPLKVQPLPRPKRWLKLPKPELLIPRETESYSSLSRYVYSPHQWLFDYAARLRPGRLVDFRVHDDARRQGSLLHGFVENLLEPEADDDEPTLALDDAEAVPSATGLLQTLVQRLLAGEEADWRALDEASVRAWVREQWPAVLAQQAAHYLVPGHEASSNRLQHIATESLWQLIGHLRDAKIVDAHCEVEMESDRFAGGKIRGFIDLLVEREDGALGVLDLKLGGKSVRRAELYENRHLQLAVYGHLVSAQRGVDPSCAYFIFKPNGTLLARSTEFFPGATRVQPKQAGSDWSDCWADFEQVWQWRRGQFDQGRIECTIAGTEPDRESVPPLAHWRAPKDADRFNIYRALTGWTD